MNDMDPELKKRLESEKIVHITTYERDGTPGTVAMWTLFHRGKIYMSTGRGSVKVRRLARNPMVGLQMQDRKAPMLEGQARVVTEPELIRPVSEGLFNKYDGAGEWWTSIDNMIRGFRRQDPSVLLEITLEDS